MLANDCLTLGFAASGAGDLCWIVWGVRRGAWEVVALDCVLLALDLFGLATHA